MPLSNTSIVKEALAAGEGMVRLAPCWVPHLVPFLRGSAQTGSATHLRLGAHLGGIDERWCASTTKADNGLGTPAG